MSEWLEIIYERRIPVLAISVVGLTFFLAFALDRWCAWSARRRMKLLDEQMDRLRRDGA